MTLDEIRERYIEEQAQYQAFSERVRERLDEELGKRNVTYTLESRAKSVSSVVKKALKRGYSDYAQVGDKAGVRVIATYYSELGVIGDVIGDCFRVVKVEDKGELLPDDRLGYLGIHYDIQGDGDAEAEGLRCEIQVQTRAHHLWADAAHDLLYKPFVDVPRPLRRSLYRLSALLELVDKELDAARMALVSAPEYGPAQMLLHTEDVFHEFIAVDYDRELSLIVLGGLRGSYSDAERAQFHDKLTQFAGKNRAKLQKVYDDYRDDLRANPLVLQPEALVVFERLDADRFELKTKWDFLPFDLLDGLASIWGVPL